MADPDIMTGFNIWKEGMEKCMDTFAVGKGKVYLETFVLHFLLLLMRKKLLICAMYTIFGGLIDDRVSKYP